MSGPRHAMVMPDVADTAGAVTYPVVETRLANGMRIAVSSDRCVPVVAVNLSYGMGSRDDPPGRSGSAHLLEHLMFQGTARTRRGEHETLIRQSGGACNAVTGFDRTSYITRVPSGALEQVLWLEADRMAHLREGITEDRVQVQSSVVTEERRQNEEAAPFGDLFRRTLRRTFPVAHPYHHPPMGLAADLESISAAELADMHGRYYSPGNCVLAVAGDAGAEEVARAAERFFGRGGADPVPVSAWPAGRARLPDASSPACPRDRDDVYGSRAGGLVQLAFTLPRETRGEIAAQIALLAFGHGAASRLYRRLVRAQRSAVHVTAEVTRLAGGTLGLVRVRSAPSTPAATLADRVHAELDRFVALGPEPDEYAVAAAHLEREWLQLVAAYAGRADEMAQAVLLDGTATAVNERTSLVALCPVERVREAGRQYLGGGRHACVVYHAEDERA